jgi:miniconductance mechanosensitive channel
VSSSFKNWRNVFESGGRRVKRSIDIDVSTIKFLTPELFARLKKIELLREYLEAKEKELSEYNTSHNLKESVANGRNLTNIGTFRAYCNAYLKSNPALNHKFTFMTRQLAPGPQGLPMEIYCFIADTAWVAYEGHQANIFDHLYAVLPEFELKAFQEPTGGDWASLKAKI